MSAMLFIRDTLRVRCWYARTVVVEMKKMLLQAYPHVPWYLAPDTSGYSRE